MARVTYRGESVELAAGETVLDGLERARLPVRASCRSGVCQACVLKSARGPVAASAQQGLRDGWKREGYFLSCQWAPTEDVDVLDASEAQGSTLATIAEIRRESASVSRVWLTPAAPLPYRAGQFVHVERPDDGTSRAYSLASVADLDARLELHVRRVEGGALSPWLTDEASVGRTVLLRGPLGSCCYDEDTSRDALLVLAGTSTGLAPLVGVVRRALHLGHAGPIHLYAGSLDASGLYMRDELARLAAANRNVVVHACVLGGDAPRGVRIADLGDAIVADHPGLKHARAFLCGASAWVSATKKRLFLAGIPLKAIASDAFVPTGAARA